MAQKTAVRVQLWTQLDLSLSQCVRVFHSTYTYLPLIHAASRLLSLADDMAALCCEYRAG